MAGMIPGVGVPQRKRRTNCLHYHQDTSPNYYAHPFHKTWPEPPLDETTLRARRRLELKLGSLRPSRLSENQESGHNHVAPTKHGRLGLKVLGGRLWIFQTNSSSKGDT